MQHIWGVLSEAPEENEMLVARGFTYKIEDPSIVTVNGREYMEIEVRGLRK
ncbi:ADP-ribosyltransferase [Bacillus cereus group sp. BfR-BA-01394]|uniref:ADP-ribosyltransferase n=1 Tax=Bacillus cereus group sp. BfR-BA-01394 TaxID=2920331 RepID=UPI001F59D527